jgi:hypothetical protein
MHHFFRAFPTELRFGEEAVRLMRVVLPGFYFQRVLKGRPNACWLSQLEVFGHEFNDAASDGASV